MGKNRNLGCRIQSRVGARQTTGSNARVVVLLVDHVHLRPGGELHVVVRALQACTYSISRVHTSLVASGEWEDATLLSQQNRNPERVVALGFEHTFLPQEGAS